jgi:hypothetical protein
VPDVVGGWGAAGSRLGPAGLTTGYGPACRAAWRFGCSDPQGGDPRGVDVAKGVRRRLLCEGVLQERRMASPAGGCSLEQPPVSSAARRGRAPGATSRRRGPGACAAKRVAGGGVVRSLTGAGGRLARGPMH